MRVAWQCEIDPDARAILAKHWPKVPCYGDIREIDWADVEPVDVICGGYPCQPFSCAGKREGELDERHLWPEVARCIRAIRPRWVLLENVSGHLSLGFGDVLGDLAALGYDAFWDCIPAAAVGAPHLRDRVFGVAWRHAGDADGMGCESRRMGENRANRTNVNRDIPHPFENRAKRNAIACGPCGSRVAPDADSNRQQAPDRGAASRFEVAGAGSDTSNAWSVGPPVSPVRRMDDGISASLDAPRLRGLGNAIVPQIPEMLGRIIVEVDRCL